MSDLVHLGGGAADNPVRAEHHQPLAGLGGLGDRVPDVVDQPKVLLVVHHDRVRRDERVACKQPVPGGAAATAS